MRITAEGLSKCYGTRKVLDDVSISCESGAITGFLGTNGAGKSTLFKLLFGLVRPDTGHISLEANQKKSLGGIIEKPCMYGYLNAEENLRLFAAIQEADTSANYIRGMLEKVGLDARRNDLIPLRINMNWPQRTRTKKMYLKFAYHGSISMA